MIEKNFIGHTLSAKGERVTRGSNPVTSEVLPGDFINATDEEITDTISKSAQAFQTYRTKTGREKAKFLRAIAEEIENLGEVLIERCCGESGLPSLRVKGECGRTTSQLRMFADLIEEGSWLEAVIENGDSKRSPVPKPDLRRMLVPLGPVAVFAASNFPLAFSTAGGDTASALAGGNTVIVKAHSAHPGTSALIAEAIIKAAKSTVMPDGVFSLLHGSGREVGQSLIQNPLLKAAGFTGSEKAGRILFDMASKREIPIPFFAEMGSVNPIVMLPSSLKLSNAKTLAGSITLGSGQFCTKPGLIIGIDGPDLDDFIRDLATDISNIEPQAMLSETICNTYNSSIEICLKRDNIKIETKDLFLKKKNFAEPVLISVTGEEFIKSPELSKEIFGPFSIVIKCKDIEQIKKILNQIDGQLTGSIFGEEEDFDDFSNIINKFERKVGRLIFNGVPTGVEVCSAMHHGGPYPASSDSRFTSVGTMAIKRFVRPISYQDWPNHRLPEELQSDNPLKIWRMVDGNLSKE